MSMIITVIYYLFAAFIAFLCIWNLIKSRNWQEEILYIVLVIPFILRVFHIK